MEKHQLKHHQIWSDLYHTHEQLDNVGEILNVETTDSTVQLELEKANVIISFYTDAIVRFHVKQKEKTFLDKTLAVIENAQPNLYEMVNSDDVIELKTTKLKVVISKSPFALKVYNEKQQLIHEITKGIFISDKGTMYQFISMNDESKFYGLGEKAGFLNKRNERLSMWNTDVFPPHNQDTVELYQSHPYYIHFDDEKVSGLFLDNSGRTTFNFKYSNTEFYFQTEIGNMDFYVYAGETIKDIIKAHTYLTGKMYMPPKWAIGHHQSRWGYNSADDVKKIIDRYKEEELGIDAIHFDIPYMEGYRVFTFNKETFPQPKELIADLKSQGVDVITIVDPGVKQDGRYHIFKEGIENEYFCMYNCGKVYFGEVWPGDSAFPDFSRDEVRKWWGENHAFYTDLGVKGIWNDMNEPAILNTPTMTMPLDVMFDNEGQPVTHQEFHNQYGLAMGKATYEGLVEQLGGERPFMLTRAGYPGIQRYSAVWTGDNRSFFEHMAMSLPMCLNLGLSGVPFCGADIGGFNNESNGELLTRWYQTAVFTPFFRNHNAIYLRSQEPWAFGEMYKESIKKTIQLRYQFMPYIYNEFFNSHFTGLPMMKPLVLNYQDDAATHNLYDEFLFGDQLLVAPILTQGTLARSVYLPVGKWFDYETNEWFEGNQYIVKKAPLDILPLFVKANSLIPQTKVVINTKEKIDEMIFNLYVDGEETVFTYTHYEDDGVSFNYKNNELLKIEFTVTVANQCVTIESTQTGDFKPQWNRYQFNVIGCDYKLIDQTTIL